MSMSLRHDFPWLLVVISKLLSAFMLVCLMVCFSSLVCCSKKWKVKNENEKSKSSWACGFSGWRWADFYSCLHPTEGCRLDISDCWLVPAKGLEEFKVALLKWPYRRLDVCYRAAWGFETLVGSHSHSCAAHQSCRASEEQQWSCQIVCSRTWGDLLRHLMHWYSNHKA